MPGRPRLAVSACLLGQRVRHDGAHKHDCYVTDALGAHFELVPVCPEVGIGLGVPRAPIRLVRTPSGLRARGVHDDAQDVTAALERFGIQSAAELGDVVGGVLKANSPSCGLLRVKVYDVAGRRAGHGRGIHAAALAAARPDLPLEEEGRLAEPALREAFLDRVYTRMRWRDLLRTDLTPAGLADFHDRHAALLRAHNRAGARRLGRHVAEAGRSGMTGVGPAYIAKCMQVLARPATVRSHTAVLQHLADRLGPSLGAGDRAELADRIEAYRAGRAVRAVPLALLRRLAARHPRLRLARQVYLEPLPPALGHGAF